MKTRRNHNPTKMFRRGLERLEARDVPSFSIPALNSLPSATAQLYLDFDGHFQSSWGSYSNLTTPAYSVDADTSTFTAAEIATIENIWARVAEDFAPFKINVTTVQPSVLAPGQPISAANGKALRVAIGGAWSDWYGASAGGVGYVNSFTNSIANVCYVFPNESAVSTYWLADVVSHEAGHSFGLQHQSTYDANGNKTQEYSTGTQLSVPFGTLSWVPLMGMTIYATTVSTWHNGPTTSATTLQDDMAVLARSANGFGYRTDDHGNSAGSATPLVVSGPNWSGAGVISTNSDVDFHSFTVTASDTFRMTANVAAIGPNLDAVIEVRNSAGQLLGTAAPADSQNASVVVGLSPGNYTVAVKSSGVYGRVGQYTLSIDRPPAGITVTPGAQSLITREDGSAASFSVVLQTQPTSNVIIPVSSSKVGEGMVSTSSLIFTPANWNVPQVVTITGVADGLVDGDVGYTIQIGAAQSADAEYAGLNADDPSVVNIDNDAAGFLYRSNAVTDTIERFRISGSQPEVLINLKSTFGTTTDYGPGRIAIDDAGGRLYWIDTNLDAIYRANLDGSNAEIVLVTGSQIGSDIEIDAATGKMYWTDSTAQTIRRANLDGSMVETVASVVASRIALHSGKIYWTEMSARTVRRANFDGTEIETIWTGDAATGTPSDLTIDPIREKVYWLAGSASNVIRRADLDGTNAAIVISLTPNAQFFGVRSLMYDSVTEKLYWQEWSSKTFYRANVDGTLIAPLAADPSAVGLTIARPAAGISVTGRAGLVTTEAGGSAQFRVSLNTKPAGNVTIAVSSSDVTEGVPSSSLLTFTPANWNVTQTVTIHGVDDAIVDADIGYTIVLSPAVSGDPNYNGIDPADAAAINLNDDVPTKFYVVDDASANRTYEYNETGGAVENYALNSGNAAPRGAASTAAGTTVWVVDANKKVYVYDVSGGLLGSWTAGSLASNATVEGIATNGTDIWIVDAKDDRVYRYSGAASRLSGSQNAASNFNLNSGNKNPKDLVTDGTSIWVLEDGSTDKVFKYSLTGSLLGSWTISGGVGAPTGITLDPSNAQQHLWIVDASTDRVYQFDNARSRTSGSQSASATFNLASGNANPQGIADPPPAEIGDDLDRIDLTPFADADSDFDFLARRERGRQRR